MVENYLNTRNRYSMFRLNQLICLKRLLFPTMLIMLPSKLYSAISFSTIGTKWEVQNTSYQKKRSTMTECYGSIVCSPITSYRQYKLFNNQNHVTFQKWHPIKDCATALVTFQCVWNVSCQISWDGSLPITSKLHIGTSGDLGDSGSIKQGLLFPFHVSM